LLLFGERSPETHAMLLRQDAHACAFFFDVQTIRALLPLIRCLLARERECG